ncbi:MAG: cupredoxin domain-containing protein [Candidatus Thermoplasmatota archaeon]
MRALLAAAVVTLLLAGCSGSTTNPPGDHQDVRVQDNKFNPTTLNLKVGSAAEFHNEGTRTHTVTMHVPDGASSKDSSLNAGGSTSYTFSKAGSYHVYCKIHSDANANGMSMTVTVN